VATALSAPRVSILRCLALAGFIAAVYGILQYFGIDPLVRPTAYEAGIGEVQIVRPPATFGHSNYFRIFLILALAASAALAITDQRPWGWFAIAAIATMLTALILTGSRGAWLGAAVFTMVFFGLRRPSIKTVAAMAGIGAALLAGFYFSPAGARLRAR